jgi:hypothetical protein
MRNAAPREEVRLEDLRGIGKKMREDFKILGVESVRQLKAEDAQKLYDRMCEITGTRQDPCVLDTYRCAIEQARNPNLPEEQKDWWYWSKVRKTAGGLSRPEPGSRQRKATRP